MQERNIRRKTLIVYKPIIAWNILVSLVVSLFFVINGFSLVGLYVFVIFLKLIGYGSSIAFNQFFLTSSSYFYKNLGINFRRIMINIIIYDIIVFIAILIIAFSCRNFILTVLPKVLITKPY